MALFHLCVTLAPEAGASRPRLGLLGGVSAYFVHLRGMDERSDQQAGGQLVSGVFEAALSLRELAAELSVSCQTLYDLRSQGRGPTGFRVGRCLRFRRSEIEAWLARLEHDDAERHGSEQAR